MSATVFSIPPARPFLPTLAAALLSGELVPGFAPGGDPLALAGATIHVPSRRAARALAAALGEAMGGRSAILPAIRVLGADEDPSLRFDAAAGLGLLPVMDPTERHLRLARLVRQWRRLTALEDLKALGGAEPVLPSSPADALWLARDLAALMDEVEQEGASLSGIETLAPDDLADWWRLTLAFLSIVTRHWPRTLAEAGLTTAARAHEALLAAETRRLTEQGSTGPVVVAGVTSSAPPLVRFMAAVAALPNGALVLPGLDRDLEPEGFAAIGEEGDAAASGHPQDGLKRLLQALGVAREDVRPLGGEPPAPLRAREALVSDAMRPARTTERWAEAPGRHGPQALAAVSLVEAEDERQEALAVAVAMREALSDPNARAGFVTPDRSLARRVVAELARFGIEANDSAGRPLAATAPGTLMKAAVEAALCPGDPIVLVELLKHPLARLGLGAGEARRGARTLEMLALRGTVGLPDAMTLATVFGERRRALEASVEEERLRIARPVALLSQTERDLGGTLAERLAEALRPLAALRGAERLELPDLVPVLVGALEALARDPEGDAGALYAEEAGQAMAGFLSALAGAPRTGFTFAARDVPDVLAALVAGETVRPRGGLSSRAFVWGALEARLQSVDRIVLGGLNEGTWPSGARGDAFLSRPMRLSVALPAPERRIGLAAHDVWMAMGAPQVVLTRARRAGGAPSVPSRWLQRLLAVAGPAEAERLRAAGAVFLAHARGLDAAGPVPRVAPPAPVPPREKRPRSFSVTEVETLIRDPYAVHARRILKLEPLPELMRSHGARDRGSLLHEVLAQAVIGGLDLAAPDAAATLLALARDLFDKAALPPEVDALWWPRMEALARDFVAVEGPRRDRRRVAECGGTLDLADLGVSLRGFADRIDRLADGRLEIRDYKTGSQPSVKQARSLLAPQLPLEAAMAEAGAFEGIDPAPVADLLYVRLRERGMAEERLATEGGRGEPARSAPELGAEALFRFRGLAAHYLSPDTPFRSRARPFKGGDFTGDYDHLARAREWSVGTEDGGEGEGAGA
ncbi:double-strand break repair protein AddB [Aurantimonas sp. Leaf443]|uniref:double-strand break repair protein AddB n=1 Tax=Aurantimonas sp. Leaf443 TaxID=1736378 RepID=UPI0006F7C1E3|nr:double-strand break repair protein AddB [Aurantimonas sp. Leaf443]KQT83977.1 double-strand break repair protein AddB [Aurantimonas sp. Leaf443]